LYLVDEEDIAGAERREHPHEISGALEHRARGRADADAQLLRHQERERRLTEAGRSEKQRVVERLFAVLRRVDRDLERLLDLRLPDELVQARGAQRGLRGALLRE